MNERAEERKWSACGGERHRHREKQGLVRKQVVRFASGWGFKEKRCLNPGALQSTASFHLEKRSNGPGVEGITALS